MRVVHVTRDFPPRSCGGISTAVGGLVAASVGRVDVSVVSFDAYRPKRRSGRGAVRDDRGGVDILRVSGPDDLAAARAFVADAAAQVLHVHDGMLWSFAEGCPAERRVFTPHVVHRALNRVRGIDERTLSLAGEEAALAGADVVVAPSEAAARWVGREAWVAPLGVAPPPSRASAGGPPTLLHVGRFDAAKGTDDLLEIAGRVLGARPDAVLEIAGGIPENPKLERRRRRRIVAALPDGLGPRVRLLGWLAGDALEAAWARADVLVQPSRIETVSLAVLEGMARGVPVVTTRCGGPEERITPATGRLVDVGDVDGAAAATLELLDDPALRARLGGAAAEAARAWTWGAVVDRWLAAYATPDQPYLPGTEQATIFDSSE